MESIRILDEHYAEFVEHQSKAIAISSKLNALLGDVEHLRKQRDDAKSAMWEFIHDKYPETRVGEWAVSSDGFITRKGDMSTSDQDSVSGLEPIQPYGEHFDRVKGYLRRAASLTDEVRKQISDISKKVLTIEEERSSLWMYLGIHFPQVRDGSWTIDPESATIYPSKDEPEESDGSSIADNLRKLFGDGSS